MSPTPDVDADRWLAPLLNEQVCFDTTVPMHMQLSGLGDLLRATFAGRAVWPEAVRADLMRNAGRVAGLRELATGPFAQVVELEPDEEVLVEDLRLTTMTRRELRAKPTLNRGEAECVTVCERLPSLSA